MAEQHSADCCRGAFQGCAKGCKWCRACRERARLLLGDRPGEPSGNPG